MKKIITAAVLSLLPAMLYATNFTAPELTAAERESMSGVGCSFEERGRLIAAHGFQTLVFNHQYMSAQDDEVNTDNAYFSDGRNSVSLILKNRIHHHSSEDSGWSSSNRYQLIYSVNNRPVYSTEVIGTCGD